MYISDMNEAYKNKDLQDLPNEAWVDVLGYDGIYQVSNLGRVKSLGRWVNNGKSERWVKERILSQAKSKDQRLSVVLAKNNLKESRHVSYLVFFSFNPEAKEDEKEQVIIHKNKIATDNRLENLQIGTWSESHAINYRKGLIPHLKEARERPVRGENRKTAVVINGEVVKKKCKDCKQLLDAVKFEKGRNTCHKCTYERKKKNSKV